MILAYAVILLILLAVVTRRDLSAIGRTRYNGGWRLGLGILVLYLFHDVVVLFTEGRTNIQMSVLIVSQVGLAILLMVNHRLPGVKIFVLGILLNTLVMGANGGWMPVSPQTHNYVHPDRSVAIDSRPEKSKNVVIPKDETRFWVLSDAIRVALPWRRYAMSIGDVLLVVGVAQFIFQITSTQSTRLLRT